MRLRPVLAALAAAALAATAAPALAVEEPVEPAVLEPCEAVEGATTLSVGSATGTVPTPSFLVGNERETVSFVLDLAGQPEGTTATVAAALEWGVPANDYDLELAAGSAVAATEGFQPVDPAVEQTSLSRVAHCALVDVTAIDFTAPVVVDTITWTLGVAAKKPA